MDRITFLKRNLLFGGAIALGTNTLRAETKKKQDDILSQELILEFVFAAHKSLEETQRLLDKYPLVLNCTNQFKKGDFETAVGGASHMGRKDIVDFLVSRGARLDIFNYAFLGYDGLIKKWITDHPNYLTAPGPHGFTLLHHAEVGGHNALAQWLQDKGLNEKMFKGIFG